MKVFRCHHKDGLEIGPFNGGCSVRLKGITVFDHPEPCEDGIWIDHRELFGCPNLRSICHWFGESAADLDWNGFIISEIEVDDLKVKIGNQRNQCAFPMDGVSVLASMGVRSAIFHYFCGNDDNLNA